MTPRTQQPALDRFRLLAAVLVVCIHTSPLSSASPSWDFWLTRVLARTAVPFFFMVSGYFLLKVKKKGTAVRASTRVSQKSHEGLALDKGLV